MMAPDEGAIDALAQAVLDGEPVDWQAAESDPVGNVALIKHLRAIATLVHAQRESAAPAEDGRASASAHWGHLRLAARIGRGAFGEVYRARDTLLERDVALKLALADGRDPSTLLREGRLLARVRHPNVVTVHGADSFGGRAGLWMDLVPGRTLESLLEDGEAFPPAEVVRIGLALARALEAVHEAGLLHRDVKAQNVMREADGRIVLMDFGTGLRLDEQQAATGGTPLYLAPELLNGEPATVQSDIYSLGVLLFHLLTRSFPVRGATLKDLRRAHQQGDRADLRALVPDVPPPLARIIERAIDPRPEARYSRAGDMAADFEAAVAPPRRRWPWFAGVAVATAALASLAWFTPGQPVLGVPPYEVRGTSTPDDGLGEGLAIDLNRRLTQLEGVQVRLAVPLAGSRTPDDRRAASRRLGASHLLQARVIGDDGIVHSIEAALVRTRDGRPLWSETFLPRNNDLFAVQEQIVLAVAGSLGLQPARALNTHQTEPGLQRLFYRARALRLRRDAKSREEAVLLLEHIHSLDPAYVPAAAALARALLTIAGNREMEPPLDPRAKALALETYARDPAWPDANAARGLLCAYQHDWACARRFFEEAIRLEPTASENHIDFVLTTLLPLGLVDEALRVIEHAGITDPMSLDVKRALAHAQVESGRYSEAIDTSRAVLAEDPDLRYVAQWLGRALYLSGRAQEALEFFEQEYLQERVWMYRAYALALLGRQDEARTLMAQHAGAQLPGHMLVYAGLGDRDRAFEMLRETATLDPWRALTWMQRPEMALLRGDPRYGEIRRQLLQKR